MLRDGTKDTVSRKKNKENGDSRTEKRGRPN